MKHQKLTVDMLTKDVPFDEVLPLIAQMIRRIAYSVNGVYGLEREDLEQELSLMAYTSWQAWDPNGGTKFSTYVYEILVKHKNHLVRKAKAQCRNGGVRPASLDIGRDSGHGDHDPDGYQFYDFCPDTSEMSLEDRVYLQEVQEVIEQVIRMQIRQAQPVLRLLLTGMTQEAVSREAGVTQSQVSYYLKNFRTRLREEFERRDFDLPFAAN